MADDRLQEFDVCPFGDQGRDGEVAQIVEPKVAARLSDSAVFPVEPSSRLHREALATFERQVIEGVLRHAGDPVVSEQLAWTGVDRYENGDPRRLRKLEKARPIDASVALALAVWRVSVGGGSNVYEERGLLIV
ncbi:MAG: hypothetical protein ACR2L0_06505 [Gaiellaceae bacterium]